MHIHILGICGSFMAGIAVLARELGHSVSGSDANAYPPMSTQLADAGINVFAGYTPANLNPEPDVVIIGNALSRGNPEVEAVLDRGLAYTSGAQWVADHVLRDRWVIAVSGTHGKTTTASMTAWILEHAGINPGFLIGGVLQNLGVSARLGGAPFFVIEADEYDTAFFDKRSKFVHYRPRTAILNNLEFDHADIFPDLNAIQVQFHHFVRTVPASGLLIVNATDENVRTVLDMGHWTPIEFFDNASGWSPQPTMEDGGSFRVLFEGRPQGEVQWGLIGKHNMMNALAAIAAARHAGVSVTTATEGLCRFENVKRRLELSGTVRGITIYDDFAHHPTAIAATLQALRSHVGRRRIFAVLEPRSNSMRMGVHRDSLAASLSEADQVLLLQPPDISWDMAAVSAALNGRARILSSVDAIVATLVEELRGDDRVLIMSNGDFGGLHEKLLACLRG
ncbi:MAG: UDP-N-acetylmuramate:L-alanyl-gamma-D-glutamyl-meso-diaminopimelate ligase [Acidiferrobacterales bacterium]